MSRVWFYRIGLVVLLALLAPLAYETLMFVVRQVMGLTPKPFRPSDCRGAHVSARFFLINESGVPS